MRNALLVCVLTASFGTVAAAITGDFIYGTTPLRAGGCELVTDDFGPDGTVPIQAETVANGLEVPWAMAFLPNGDILVTERPGRIRIITGGALKAEPVATITVRASGEGGLLGIAAHPDFATNRYFYVYYTFDKPSGPVNRVERYVLSQDSATATPDRIIIDDIPGATLHDGGRIRFGPDGNLYVGTGEAQVSARAQALDYLGGKILRLTPEGTIPSDNPFGGSNPVFILGVRNNQGFDWLDRDNMLVIDHGPTGEFGRTGGDELNIAGAGANLGWPDIWKCEERSGFTTPIISWNEALPPAGITLYTGDAIPQWKGSFLIGTLGSKHLHRVVIDPLAETLRLTEHEVYLRGDPPSGYGRLRDVVNGPDGFLYVTTSNCDGRGSCPDSKDAVLRIKPGP